MATNLDQTLAKALAKSINVAVPWFLCTSYLYYQRDISILSDQEFDKMCALMLANWAKIKHPHKHFIKRSHLTAGTGFDLPWRKLPAIVYGASAHMASQLTGP